jgi:hypothetical protein
MALDCFASLAVTEKAACAQVTREIRMALGIAEFAAMHKCLSYVICHLTKATT